MDVAQRLARLAGRAGIGQQQIDGRIAQRRLDVRRRIRIRGIATPRCA
jgi:hypothetical protein